MGPNKDLSMSSISLQLLLHVGQGTELAGIDQMPSGPLLCIFSLPFFFFSSHRKGIIPKLMIESPMVRMNLAFGFPCFVLAHQCIWWPAPWLVNGDGPCLFFSETSLMSQQGKTLSHGHAQSSCSWMNCQVSFMFWQRVGQNPKSCH